MDAASPTRHPFERQIRLLLRVGLLLFVWVIVIGIANGLELVELTRALLLSHLHGGMLGWLTLGIFAATLWLFGSSTSDGDERQQRTVQRLTVLAIVGIGLYVIAFASTVGVIRPLSGTLTFLALLGFTVWAYRRAGSAILTVPRLLILVGLTASLIGGAFGVINGLAIALEFRVPRSFFEAHPGTMTVGFIMPVAMGLSEWGLRQNEPEEPTTRAGRVQVGLMVLAFAWVLGFTLANVPEIAGVGVVFAIVALGIFFVRMWPAARRTSLVSSGAQRHALAGGLLLGVTIVYIFLAITAAGGDFTMIPRNRIIAFTHLEAVAASTNAMLAFVVFLSRGTAQPTQIDHVVFWGLNIGVIGFVVALTIEAPAMYVIFVPVMGVALLIAVATHVRALASKP